MKYYVLFSNDGLADMCISSRVKKKTLRIHCEFIYRSPENITYRNEALHISRRTIHSMSKYHGLVWMESVSTSELLYS